MLASLLKFLISAAASILGVLLLLRAWIYVWAFSPRHPLAQLAKRSTDWLVQPLSHLVKPKGNYDWPSLLATLIVAVVTMFLLKPFTGYPVSSAGAVIMPLAMVVRWALEMISWGAFFEVILSWLSPGTPLTYALETLMEPFLRPVRRVLPTLGRFDWSPVAVIILANILLFFVVPLSHGIVGI